MKNIIKFFQPRINPFRILRGRPNFKLVKGARLTSALFIGVSIALAAGIIFGANIYYDIDTSKIMIGDTQQSTTTQITVDTANTTALTVTQRGTAAAVSATSTSAMTSDIFKITNLGSGKSFVVEDSDTDSSPFVVDASGNVGIASSTPSAALGVQGNVMIANGVLSITTTTATSTLAGPLQISQIKITGPNTPVAAYVLTATDTLGNASWQVIPTGTWISLNGNLYPTTISDNVAISTTTARYDLDVWGDASFGTTTDYNTPLLLVNSSTKRVGIASSTPSSALGVQGNVMIANGVLSITTTTATSSLGMIDITAFRMATGNPGVNKVLTTVEGSGYGVWTSIAGAGGITGSGTAGKLSKFTDTSVIADSVITEADGKIGISTTTPRYGLDVWGDFSVGTSTAGYASGASSTPALFVDSGNGGRVGIGTTTLTNSLFAVGTSTTRFVVALNGNVGVATSTPSDTLAVGGNIIGSGNLVIYGTGTSTFGGGLSIAGLETTGAIWSDNALTLTSSGGAIILTPLSNSNADIVLGGTGLFRVGSTGQFYIDASGNVTTTGSIYAAEGFRTTATNATVRKVGDEILRGVVPVFGFDLPVRCKTSCSSGTATATISRVVENNDDIFPMAYGGTTRRYRFSIRYADATTTVGVRTTWDVATSADRTYTDRFTLPPTDTTDLAKGFTTTTNFVTLPTTDDWFLRVSTGNTGAYDLQVYEILLIGIDQVN